MGLILTDTVAVMKDYRAPLSGNDIPRYTFRISETLKPGWSGASVDHGVSQVGGTRLALGVQAANLESRLNTTADRYSWGVLGVRRISEQYQVSNVLFVQAYAWRIMSLGHI